MKIKTSKDRVSSLRGSAFRKATYDGRTWRLREIRTLHARSSPFAAELARRALPASSKLDG